MSIAALTTQLAPELPAPSASDRIASAASTPPDSGPSGAAGLWSRIVMRPSSMVSQSRRCIISPRRSPRYSAARGAEGKAIHDHSPVNLRRFMPIVPLSLDPGP